MKTHAMRKYFESRILDANVEGRFRTQIVGAKPNYRDSVYDNNLKNISWVYKKWLDVEKAVCVDCIIVDNTSEEVKVLKQENFELRNDIINMKKQNLDIQKEQKLMKEMFNAFMNISDQDKIRKYLDGLTKKDK